MLPDLCDAVAWISGSASSRFGTGFVIRQDGTGTYVVTCAHVIDDIGGADAVKVDDLKAEVLALDGVDGFDLAVLRLDMPGRKRVLALAASGKEGNPISTLGYHAVEGARICRKRVGALGNIAQRYSTRFGHSPAWYLDIDAGDGPQGALQSGNSGGPVLDRDNNVIGIVNLSLGEGN